MGIAHNKELDKAIREIGWENFDKYILETGLCKREAYLKERMYIAFYHSDLLHGGYNRQSGGKEDAIVWGIASLFIKLTWIQERLFMYGLLHPLRRSGYTSTIGTFEKQSQANENQREGLAGNM